MKIYVKKEGTYSDYHIVALCEDKEKAIKIVRDRWAEYKARANDV